MTTDLPAAMGETAPQTPPEAQATIADLQAANRALVINAARVRDDALVEAADKVREWQAFTRYAKERISEEMAQDVLSLRQSPARISRALAQHQPCGCQVCICEDDEQCQGCGAKPCGTHPVGEIPEPVYAHAALQETPE